MGKAMASRALFISSGPLFLSHRRERLSAMAALRVRAPCYLRSGREFPEAGGLVSYGAEFAGPLYRQVCHKWSITDH